MRTLILAATLLLAACGGGGDKPSGPRFPPKEYEILNGSTTYIPASNPIVIGEYGLNAVTKEMSLRGKTTIRIRFRIDAPLVTKTEPIGPGLATLYFQRRGDNWTAQGKLERYRWYGTFGTVRTNGAGEYELVGTIDDRWTAVMTSNSVDQHADFMEAWDQSAHVGFVLGGGTGYGHGVYGPATLTIISFDVT